MRLTFITWSFWAPLFYLLVLYLTTMIYLGSSWLGNDFDFAGTIGSTYGILIYAAYVLSSCQGIFDLCDRCQALV